MSSINLNMTSVEVKAEVRPLRCAWTAEMASDLNSFHGLDPSVFEKSVRREIRREKIKNIFNKVKP
jgi:hypothetical protein